MRLASVLHGPRDSRAPSGFSLIEVLIALTLLGIALLLGMDLLLQNPRVVRRLDGERQAFRAMESTLEAVRAGVIPLETAELGSMVTAVGAPAPKDLTISMQVGPAGLPGLYQVTLVAQYSVLHQKYKKKLQTMVWSPPT
jgi:prepilin-type N-terminal cleavage/methylation domain-containing protein